MQHRTWHVTGALLVDETLTTRTATGRPIARRRPLAGVEVEVAGWPDEHACTAVWAHVRTDAHGRFTVDALRPAWAHALRVRARFVAPDLRVHPRRELDDAVDGWRTVAATPEAVDGPLVAFGELVHREGSDWALGEPPRVRAAAAWYVARAAIDYLVTAGPDDASRAPVLLAVPDAGVPVIDDDAGDGDGDGAGDDALRAVLRRVVAAWLAHHPVASARWARSAGFAAHHARVRPRAVPVSPPFVERVLDSVVAALWPRPRDHRLRPTAYVPSEMLPALHARGA